MPNTTQTLKVCCWPKAGFRKLCNYLWYKNEVFIRATTMNRISTISTMLMSFIITPSVDAEEFTELHMRVYKGVNRCAIEEVLADVPKDTSRRIYRGEYSDSGCIVTIPKEHFAKEFEICYLNGFKVINSLHLDDFGCSIDYTKGEWQFKAVLELTGYPTSNSIGDTVKFNGIQCTFLCKNK